MRDFDSLIADSQLHEAPENFNSSSFIANKEEVGKSIEKSRNTFTYCTLSEYEEMNPSKRSHMEDVHFVIPSLFPESSQKKSHLR